MKICTPGRNFPHSGVPFAHAQSSFISTRLFLFFLAKNGTNFNFHVATALCSARFLNDVGGISQFLALHLNVSFSSSSVC